MQTVELGDSGVRVSALCLGAMFFGTKNDLETSRRMLERYADAGGTFIDTANIYAHWVEGGRGGESETLLGDWMRERGNRDSLFIATKVGFQYPGVAFGLSARQIEDECEKSLRRLQTDVIDLYYAHVDDRDTPLEETMEAFDKLVRVGKVRYIAASNYLAWRLEQARGICESNGWAQFIGVQQRMTYLRPKYDADFAKQRVANSDLFDYSRTMNFPILAYSALLGGAYTRDDRPLPDQYRTQDSQERLIALNEVAADLGLTPNQVILAWMLQHTPPIIPLIAASSDEQMDDNLNSLNVRLSDEQWHRLTTVGA